jgi:hypothetical protein
MTMMASRFPRRIRTFATLQRRAAIIVMARLVRATYRGTVQE